jgi:putative membrane protein
MMEIILVIIFAILGTCLGVLTGLIPWLLVNNIAVIMLSASPALLVGLMFLEGYGVPELFIPMLLAVIILAMSIAHTFLDFIPSTFLGAPEGETALSVLPAHSMLLEGRGYEAVMLSAIGSFGGIVIAFIFLIPFRFIIGEPVNGYLFLKQIMVYVLIAICILILFSEQTKIPYKRTIKNGQVKFEKGIFSRSLGISIAVIIFLVSGIFGYIILRLDISSPFGLPATPLFPALGGLFGLATLFDSLRSTSGLPEQKITRPVLDKKETVKSVTTGSIAGSTVGFLPGLSSGVATVVAMIFRKEPEREQVIVTLSAINTTNAFFVLVALFLILRPRSGAAIVVNQLIPVEQWSGASMPTALIYLLLAGLVAAILGFFLTLYIGKKFASVFIKFPYKKIVTGIIIFIIIMVFAFTGVLGLFILAVSTCIGLLPPYFGVRRSHAMGVLLIPVIVMLW